MSKNVKKAVINTLALYGKIVINIFVAIFTTRIVLNFLGEVDFGIYSLIAGVVAMLSFLNGALLQATQRFLSIEIGKGKNGNPRQIFNAGVGIHLIMAFALIALLLGAKPFLFGGFLNIPPERVGAAINTYYLVIVTTVITFFTIPFNAAINAREEMWFFAFTDVLMSLMKLGAAIVIMYINDTSGQLLVIYTAGITASTLIVLVIKAVWSTKRYKECRIALPLLWNRKQIKAQLGFTGWNTLVTIAVLFRNQGVAIILNVFFGPILNAAYGIANQINGVVSNFATSISTVFAPQIIQSYSSDNKERMLRLAIFSSKVTLLLSALLGFPFLLESNVILKLWLGHVPEHAPSLCKLIIISFIIQQFYPGLLRCLYAEGDIKRYQIIISTVLILPIAAGYILFSFLNIQPEAVLYLLIAAQFFSLIVTVKFAKTKVGLNPQKFYVASVFKPTFSFVVIYFIFNAGKNLVPNDIVRLLLVTFASSLLLVLQFYFFILNANERTQIRNMFDLFLKKKKRNEKNN